MPYLKLWRHLSYRRRKQFFLLSLLMIFAAMAEVMTLGAVLPFLSALIQPEKLFLHPYAQPFIQYLDIKEPTQVILPFTLVFALSALIAGIIRLLMIYVSTRLSYAAGTDLSITIYKKTLYQPYSVHMSRNSSEVINGVVRKTDIITRSVLMSLLTLISSSVILIFIVVTLIFLEPVVAILSFVGFGSIYIIIIRAVRKKLVENGKSIALESTQVVKLLQEGLGGIRDIIIDGSQSHFYNIYKNADKRLRQTQGSNQFLSIFPRYAIESLGLILIAYLAYKLSLREEGLSSAVPILGVMALGAQRLLPILQQCYAAITQIKGSQASLMDTLDLLEQPLPTNFTQEKIDLIPFKKDIKLQNVGFRYGSTEPWVFRNIDITIRKGERVGFIGSTGSGKSTLLDIIMVLLSPTEGEIRIDNQCLTPNNLQNWQAHIAHVPQQVFLSDNTIEENIAFGIPADKIDKSLVIQAAKKAQIYDLIEGWPEKCQTVIGERGTRLSGGQQQRIGIARALYKKADVIIFDEATSALDAGTERAVMDSIEKLDRDLTVLVIAHRLTTLQGCDRIIEIGDCGVMRSGTYNNIIDSSA